MTKKFSVIYDPVAKVPFGIIQEVNGVKLAHPIQVSANHWATRYNGGEKVVPHGMTGTDFVEMDCDFIESFKSAFGATGRAERRSQLLSNQKQEMPKQEFIYGTSAAPRRRRKNGVSKKVMPVIEHLQRDLFRQEIINETIRTGKRWLKKRED